MLVGLHNPLFLSALVNKPVSGGGGTCASSPVWTQTGAAPWGLNRSYYFYAGGQYVGTGETVCKIGFQLSAAGDISARTFNAKIFNCNADSGYNLGSLIATSNGITGNNSWSYTDVVFTFATPVTLTNGFGYAITIDNGVVDESNCVVPYYSAYGGPMASMQLWDNTGTTSILWTPPNVFGMSMYLYS